MHEETVKSIRDVIDSISPGFFFDSHFVIKELILNHSNAYLRGFSDSEKDATARYHSEIAKAIERVGTSKVERGGGKALSHNIRGNQTECELWKRV